MAKPFLKWVGGKRWLAPELKQHLIKAPKRYMEPFAGGGALYFSACHRYQKKPVLLSDTNRQLMETYLAVRDDPRGLIDDLRILGRAYRETDPREFYLQVREEFNNCPTPAKMIFLNKTGFNGLYRVNSKGEFNVPWGKRPNAQVCDAETILECSRVLRGVTLREADAFDVIDDARQGDLMYLDPPYYGTFRGYTSMSKAYEHTFHEKLAEKTTKAVIDRGVNILMSNSYCDEVDSLYTSGVWRKMKVYARRSVSRKADGRQPEPEFLLKSYGERK